MSIMIKLTNINRRGNIIHADVTTVEVHPKTFTIEVDTVEKKLVKNTRGRVDMEVGMAMAKLVKLNETSGKRLPKQAESMWY